jgi:hypothetical protein
MMASPLGDGPAFVGGLERVYRSLWRRHCARAWAEQDSASGSGGSAQHRAGMPEDGSMHDRDGTLPGGGRAEAVRDGS